MERDSSGVASLSLILRLRRPVTWVFHVKFHVKLKVLMDLLRQDLTNNMLYGRSATCTYFDFVRKKSCIALDMVDSLIRAKLPVSAEDPEYYDVVKTHTIHGPCGVPSTIIIQKKDSQCTKQYPKLFVL